MLNRSDISVSRHVGWAILFAALLLSGCASTGDVSHSSASNDVLRIGIAPGIAPYAYKQSGRLTGLEVDFGKSLARALNRKPVFIEMKSGELVSALENERIDIIMSGLKVSDANAMRIAYTKPYLQMGQMILVRSGDYSRYMYPQVVLMSEARIGVVKGTTGDLLVLNATRNAKRKVFRSAENAVQALVDGKVDAVIHDGPVILYLAAEHALDGVSAMKSPVTTEYLAWAVNRDNEDLLDEVVAVQDRWTANGVLDDILTRAMPFLSGF